MSGGTAFEARRRVASARHHDYLYDSAYIVSGARDYARTAFKAAMGSAQLVIQPVYKTMFSELRKFPRVQVVYHPNCRLPEHIDTSYNAYCNRISEAHNNLPTPELTGKDRFKFSALPKKVLEVKAVSPEFHPPSPLAPSMCCKPRNRGTQSVFRESSAQTTPWQPNGKAAPTCENTPEVLFLDKLEWGHGKPYRTGDLPADFHTTEIINKMRHARVWNEVAERGKFPRWMKKRDEIICDVEIKDWIFREAEIDELQEIRMSLMHKLQKTQRTQKNNRTCRKLAKRWETNKKEMEHKIDTIRKSRDRELRKLSALHSSGGRLGLVQRVRAQRAMGSPTAAAADPTSDVFAPLARHGYQARSRHATIQYDPSLLLLEDHRRLAEPPAWLEECGQNLQKSYSGHPLPRNPMMLCERETKWSEDFLENLHNDLKKARMGAAVTSVGPRLHVLKPRRLQATPRPATPAVDPVMDADEAYHQASLHLQRIIRGRAVQILMYEGRTRAAELTEELKTTHGLQKEDKIRIAQEDAKARDYNSLRTEAEKKEEAITALVDELCGGAVSAALDFLEKELRRLREERRHHAFIMIALREKQMREAAEAGRRQKEIHRRREHDEMFKSVLGITQDTVESYLQDIITEGVTLTAELEGVQRAERQADQIDEKYGDVETLRTADQNELIAELVQQFLLPAAHKQAAKHHIESVQAAKLEAARKTIFGLLDSATIKEPQKCIQCGTPLDEKCRCLKCNITVQPVPSESRDDKRWKATRVRPKPPQKTASERFPPAHEFRCMLNTLIDEVVVEARRAAAERDEIRRECRELIKEGVEIRIDAKDMAQDMLDMAMGLKFRPIFERKAHHYSKHIRPDALERTEPVPVRHPCPLELPSARRRRADEAEAAADVTCRCESPEEKDERKPRIRIATERDPRDPKQRIKMLPSEVRKWQELRKCKCDDGTEENIHEFQFEDMTTSESTDYEFEDAGMLEDQPLVQETKDEKTEEKDEA